MCNVRTLKRTQELPTDRELLKLMKFFVPRFSFRSVPRNARHRRSARKLKGAQKQTETELNMIVIKRIYTSWRKYFRRCILLASERAQ